MPRVDPPMAPTESQSMPLTLISTIVPSTSGPTSKIHRSSASESLPVSRLSTKRSTIRPPTPSETKEQASCDAQEFTPL
nr:hypothetical protein [Sphingomonas fennica]